MVWGSRGRTTRGAADQLLFDELGRVVHGGALPPPRGVDHGEGTPRHASPSPSAAGGPPQAEQRLTQEAVPARGLACSSEPQQDNA